MQIHNLKRNNPNKKRKTVGRGGTRGKTAGRGTKGQNARAGHKKRPEIRDFIKRIPKLRGRGKNINTSRQTANAVVSLSFLNKSFADNDVVSLATLISKGFSPKVSGKYIRVKILANGNLDKKLTIDGCAVSAEAKIIIEKAGGIVK